MDKVDSLILVELLVNPRATQRMIARRLSLTPQLVNYRVRRLWERGVIKRIHLYVDPRVYGLLPGIIVTKGKVDTPLIVWLSECLEGRVISYIAVPSYSCIDRLASELGDGLLVYRLSKDSGRTKKLSTFRPLADYLLKHPNAKISDISRALGISQRSASKKYRLALKYGAIKYVPIIDLSQADILLLSIITRVGITSIPIVRSRLLWSFNSEELHVGILYASNIREAKSIAEGVEKLDPRMMVSVKTSYEYYSYRPEDIGEYCGYGG